jgi:hypothetical protein
MSDTPLTPEQEGDAQRYAALFVQLAQRDARQFGELMATCPDAGLFGGNEFELRARAHRLAAAFLEAALEERKKGATSVPASSVHSANPTPI